MSKVRGMLIETKGPLGVVMTSDGRFVRVVLFKAQKELGREITASELRFSPVLGSLIAACLIMIFLVGMWAKMLIPTAAAYVALDINPSVELAVDNSGSVIDARGLDQEGKTLLANIKLKRIDIYKAVEIIVGEAAEQKYLNSTNNIVLLTVTNLKGDNSNEIDEKKLSFAVKLPPTASPVAVQAIVGRATKEERKKAEKQGISAGRYLIHQGDIKGENKLTPGDIKNKGLGQLEKERGVEIKQLIEDSGKISKPASTEKEPGVNKENKINQQENGKSSVKETGASQKYKVPPGQLKGDDSSKEKIEPLPELQEDKEGKGKKAGKEDGKKLPEKGTPKSD